MKKNRTQHLFNDYEPLIPKEDFAVTKSDFETAGSNLHYRPQTATQVWNSITFYEAGLKITDKFIRGETLTPKEQKFMNERITERELAMYRKVGELSFIGLQENFVNGYIGTFNNVAEMGLRVVKGALGIAVVEHDYMSDVE